MVEHNLTISRQNLQPGDLVFLELQAQWKVYRTSPMWVFMQETERWWMPLIQKEK